jgi:hypothetical protein
MDLPDQGYPVSDVEDGVRADAWDRVFEQLV